ncbi:hypothetical protein G7054_g2972 [Neopestalotiopsis clavispora]|nr:hypothetical protein G7054_g2972 [Neopestalotiopsis clavispora]
MLREVVKTKQVMRWMSSQPQKLNSPICQVWVRPFCAPWILLADYREAQDLLLRRGKEFDRSSFTGDLMAPAGGFHLLHKTGPTWKAARSWLQDLMTPSFLNRVAAPALYDKALDLVTLWERKAALANERPFSAALDMHHAALDAVLAFMFGSSVRSFAIAPQLDLLSSLAMLEAENKDIPVLFPQAPLDDFIVTAVECGELIDKIINSPVPKITYWMAKLTPSYRRFTSLKNSFLSEQIQSAVRRLRKSENKSIEVRCAVDHIVMREEAIAEKHNRPADFKNQDLIDEIFGNLIAGHDTSSSALSWVLKYLTDYPDVQAKLRSALSTTYSSSASGKTNPTLEELTQRRVPYLDAVIEEALRLSPISVTREATCDTKILGHDIPKGTVVFLLSNGPSFFTPSFDIDENKRSPTCQKAAITRHWDELDDMTAFKPERWLRQTNDGAVEFDLTAGPQLVFGLGTRSCFGRRLAYLEMRIITAMIAWNFELSSVPQHLGGYDAVDGVTHRARQCFIRLKMRRVWD